MFWLWKLKRLCIDADRVAALLYIGIHMHVFLPIKTSMS